MDTQERDHVLILLEESRKRLYVLEETAAAYGRDCHPHIKVEIEDLTRAIVQYKHKLNSELVSSSREAIYTVEQFMRDIDSIKNNLQMVEETQKSINELKGQIKLLEDRIILAIQNNRTDKIPELGAELGNALAALELRHRKIAETSKHHEEGYKNYTKGMETLQSGDSEQSVIYFKIAEDSFRQAIANTAKSDLHYSVYLTDLGNTLTMQGRINDAIPYYEQAIQLSNSAEGAITELVRRLMTIGNKQIIGKEFGSAIDALEYALLLDPLNGEVHKIISLALNNEANARVKDNPNNNDWRESRIDMLRAVFHNPEEEIYQNNLKIMQGGADRKRTLFYIEEQDEGNKQTSLVEGLFFVVWYNKEMPPSICKWFELILPEYEELVSNFPDRIRSIHFWWYTQESYLTEKLNALGVNKPEIALSHKVGDTHYIVLNAEFFSLISSEPQIVIGIIAHELAHEAFKEYTANASLPDWTISSITLTTIEVITDLLAIYKGFGQYLLRSRRKLGEIFGGFEGDYPSLLPDQIERILRRDREKEGKEKIDQGAHNRQENNESASENFLASIRTWKRISQEDPTYAFAWFELSIAQEWLGEHDNAVKSMHKAVLFDTSHKYRIRLESLKMSKEEEARRLVNDGSEIESRGDTKNARTCFKQAEVIWRDYLRDYFDVARVHFELGLCLEWQKQILEAMNEFRIAASLDPFNSKYSSYLKSVLSKYGD